MWLIITVDLIVCSLSVSFTASLSSWLEVFVLSARTFRVTRVESFDLPLTVSSLFMKSVESWI